MPGKKKFFIFVAILEDKGYDLMFNKRKAFIKHAATGKVKKNCVRVKKLYKIEVDACTKFRSKEKHVQS